MKKMMTLGLSRLTQMPFSKADFKEACALSPVLFTITKSEPLRIAWMASHTR
ncbi:hypothetical protein D3C72_2438490 [compost metagenome]